MEKPGKWEQYDKQTEERDPNESLVKATELIEHKDAALDLGAGTLRDTEFLLQQGFARVVSIDNRPAARARAKELKDDRLEFVLAPFESLNLPVNAFDIVNAQYSLPFTSPESFPQFFQSVRNSLKQGGVFVGQLFGKNDSWKDNPKMTFHDKSEVEALLAGMQIIDLREEERDRNTSGRKPKHWHLFHFIVKK